MWREGGTRRNRKSVEWSHLLHDESIVHSDDIDVLHTLSLERLIVVNVPRHFRAARRGVCARNEHLNRIRQHQKQVAR